MKIPFNLHCILSVFAVFTVVAGSAVSFSAFAQECENGAVVCFNETAPVAVDEQLPEADTLPVDANTTTEPVVSDQVSTETFTAEQKTLVDGITADLKSRRLMRPVGNNALNKINRLKSILPTHDYAVNGEKYIARIYMVLARAALKNGQIDLAGRRLNSAIKIDDRVDGQTGLKAAIVAASEKSGDDSSASSGGSVLSNYADSSKRVAAEPVKKDGTTGTTFIAPVMVAIPAGKFVMGSEAGAEDEKPMREVSIEAFSMSRFEITMEQYRVYAVDNDIPAPQYQPEHHNRPVTNVSWHDAQAYVLWLTRRTKRTYRLPSEAQWEYAARAGTVTPYYTGEELLEGANCIGCGSEWGGVQTAPVGSFPANPFGLYDMHGNVWEWVQDCWTDNYFGRGDSEAAMVNQNCERFVMRGGSWYNEADYARSSYRGNEAPAFRDKGVGFRVVHDGL